VQLAGLELQRGPMVTCILQLLHNAILCRGAVRSQPHCPARVL
jgi:hypothetical protein